MRKIVLALMVAVIGLLAACIDTVVPQQTQQANFTGIPYTLNVASVEIAEDYKTSKVPPHVEGSADMPPAATFRDWVSSRIAAGGKTGRAEVVISDASIIRHDLPRQTSGIQGYFTTEQTQEFKGSLQVQIKIYDDRNILPISTITVQSRVMHTLSEHAGPADQKTLCHNMSIELLKQLEPELDRNIHEHFSTFLM